MILPIGSRTRSRWHAVAAGVIFLMVLSGIFKTVSKANRSQPLRHNDQAEAERKEEPAKPGQDVLVVLKTGATNAFTKVPLQLRTALSQVPNLIMFSDVEQHVGEHLLHGTLDGYSSQLRETGKDFESYRLLQEYIRANQDVNKLAGKDFWNLDRFKFLPAMQKTWNLEPHHNWYFFLEADIYLFWNTTLRWLEEFDAEEPLYIGAETWIGSIEFGHGGAGYIVSKAAMAKIFGSGDDIPTKYEKDTTKNCCGDGTVGFVMHEYGIELTRARPRLNSEVPYNAVFKEEAWCEPVISFHHMNGLEVQSMWDFERNHNHTQQSDYLRVKDVFEHFIAPQLAGERMHWDNDANELETDVANFESCRAVCYNQPECVTFKFYEGDVPEKGKCRIQDGVKLGHPALPERGIRSGWALDRIEGMKQKMEPCPAVVWR